MRREIFCRNLSEMANTILIGAQWGDEGKGKIIDVLTAKADVVVRSQGGNNAGHTVIHGGTIHSSSHSFRDSKTGQGMRDRKRGSHRSGGTRSGDRRAAESRPQNRQK